MIDEPSIDERNAAASAAVKTQTSEVSETSEVCVKGEKLGGGVDEHGRLQCTVSS